MRQTTVSVTGCAGFIGSHVTKQLLEKGYVVHGTVRPGEDHDYLLKLAAVLPGELVIFHADLMEPDSFKEAFAGCTYVFHIAGFVGTWNTDPHAEIIIPHVEGAKAVMKACAFASVKRVVMTSSIAAMLNPDKIHGGNDRVNEDDWSPTNSDLIYNKDSMALETYGLAKTLSEKAAWDSASELKLDLVTICPGNVWGPPVFGTGGFSLSRFVARVKDLRSGQTENSQINVVDVRDVAKAHIAAAEIPTAKGRYLVAHVDTITQNDLNAILCGICPALGCKTHDGPVGVRVVDNSKVVDFIGPLIDTNTIIADTVRALITSQQHGMKELIDYQSHT